MQKRRFLPILVLIVVLVLLLVLGYVSYLRFFITHPPTPAAAHPFTASTPLIIRPPLFKVNDIAWSPDGKRVVIANADGVFQVWDAITGQLVLTHYDSERATKIFVLGWSADGKRIISTSMYGNTALVWDAATGKTLITFNNPDRSYPLIASLSYDGQYIAIGSGSVLQLWDTSTGKQVSAFDTKTKRINYIEWSPDDSLIATINAMKSADGQSEYDIAQVWRAMAGTQACTYHNTSTSPIDHLAWSPDNRRIVSISGSGLSGNPVIAQIWDATSCVPVLSLRGTPGQASDLRWSPDGTYIVSWENYQAQSPTYQSGREAQVWDAATGKLHFTTVDHGITSVAWSLDGRQIAVAGQQMKMQVLDAATGQAIITYQDAENQNIVTLSPNGQLFASVGEDRTTIWEASAAHRITSIAVRHQVENAITWSPDSKQLAAEDGARLNVGFWDAATGGDSFGDLQIYHEDLFLFNYRNATTVAWSPDGTHVADAWFPKFTYGSPGYKVYVWVNYPVMCGLDVDCPVSGGSHTDSITSVAWSPDSKRIASASLDKTVLIYDVAHQKDLVFYRGHTDVVTAVAWSPDGKYIASGSADKTIQIWDAASGQRVLTLSGHTGAVTAVAWSPDSKLVVSGSEDGTVRVWDAVHGNLMLTYRGHRGVVMAVAWSPDGNHIASAGADTTVQVWDANTGKTMYTYHGHSDAVLAVAWSPDSKRIASSGRDGTIQIW